MIQEVYMQFYKKNKRLIVILLLTTGLLFSLSLVNCKPKSQTTVDDQNTSDETFKILHIMSYHSPWKWTDDQLDGFKEPLKDLNVEYKVVQMDTKNTNTTADQKKAIGEEYLKLIETWKPDLVYTNDDDAQTNIGVHLVNKDIPHVFSGVNNPPETYGYIGSKNTIGVLEQMHFIPSVGLLRQIDPAIKKIAVISEPGGFWDSVTNKMKEEDAAAPDIEIVALDFVQKYSDYQKKMLEYPKIADAVCLLGIFNFKDESGNNVSFDDVIKWTVNYSKLPDFSYWRDRVEKGTFASMTVSGYEQGLAAGKLAYNILAEGKSPDSFSFKPTVKGEPVLSLARAKKLGISIQSDVLLAVEAFDTFAWE